MPHFFFKKGDPFDLEHWQTPAVIDTAPYQVLSRTDSEVTFRHEAKIKNYSDTEFSIRIDRTVRLYNREKTSDLLGADLPEGIHAVAYETENILTNTGDTAWVLTATALAALFAQPALADLTVDDHHLRALFGKIVCSGNADNAGTHNDNFHGRYLSSEFTAGCDV